MDVVEEDAEAEAEAEVEGEEGEAEAEVVASWHTLQHRSAPPPTVGVAVVVAMERWPRRPSPAAVAVEG